MGQREYEIWTDFHDGCADVSKVDKTDKNKAKIHPFHHLLLPFTSIFSSNPRPQKLFLSFTRSLARTH
jgi:hypothetical protein